MHLSCQRKSQACLTVQRAESSGSSAAKIRGWEKNTEKQSWLASQMFLVDRHWLTTSSSEEFSRAAATLSLSASCLFTAHTTTKTTQERNHITHKQNISEIPHICQLLSLEHYFYHNNAALCDQDIIRKKGNQTGDICSKYYREWKILSNVLIFFTCFLWGMSARSDVDINLSGNRKTHCI